MFRNLRELFYAHFMHEHAIHLFIRSLTGTGRWVFLEGVGAECTWIDAVAVKVCLE